MTPFHVLELTLRRPTAQGELQHARAGIRPTANAGRTRLMTVQSAQPGRRPQDVFSRCVAGNLAQHERARRPENRLENLCSRTPPSKKFSSARPDYCTAGITTASLPRCEPILGAAP
ncbi:hypothetical protein ACW69C_32995 [Streptomyces sp. MN3]